MNGATLNIRLLMSYISNVHTNWLLVLATQEVFATSTTTWGTNPKDEDNNTEEEQYSLRDKLYSMTNEYHKDEHGQGLKHDVWR